MKILIYSPYLHILGGGEQYVLNFARCFSQDNQVFLVCKDQSLLDRASKRFNYDLGRLQLIPYLPARLTQRRFDLIFFVSDGSIPFLPFSQSILLFMSPFPQHRPNLVDQLKLKFINHIVCFSHYTKKFIDQEYSVNSQVIYPGISFPVCQAAKTNLIISVGRFTQTLHDKNQGVLIDTFIKLEKQLPEWQLVLAGGTEIGSKKIITQLRSQAAAHRIVIKTDISRQELFALYSQAKIYWHAAGIGTDLTKHPEKAEHFGISVVEAMSQGAVPLVFNTGGPTEIVSPETGLTWNSTQELVDQTLKLARNESLRQKFASASQTRARFFSQEKFCHRFYDLV